MSNGTQEFFDKFKNDIEKMKKQTPNAIAGFGGLFQRVMKDGALSLREKELIAFGIGLSARCVPCIKSHIQKSLDAGATKEQILEAADVAVVMGGGPTYTFLPQVIDTLQDLGK